MRSSKQISLFFFLRRPPALPRQRSSKPTFTALGICIWFGFHLTGCSAPHPNAEEAAALRANVLAQDDGPRDSGRSVEIRLNVLDGRTGKPVPQVLISGFAHGFLKPQFVEQLPFRWDCYFIPMACYTEKGGKRVLYFDGPYAATQAALLHSQDNTYTVPFADYFRLRPGFLQLAQSHEWQGTVGAQNYCTTDSEVERYYVHREVLRPIAFSVAGQPPEIDSSRQIKLKPITEHRISRMRYHVAVSAHRLINARLLHTAGHLPSLYDEVLGWAAPDSQDAFENAVYVSLLTQAGVYDTPYPAGARYSGPKFDVLSRRMEQHLSAARQIYYTNDDWRIIPATHEVRWRSPTGRPPDSDPACVTPPTLERIPSSDAWWRSFPVLSKSDHFINERSWWQATDRDKGAPAMLAKLELEPYPFCIKGVRSASARTLQKPDSGQDDKARPKFKIACRHGPPGKCKFDMPNGLGDTPLIDLARVDASSRGEYSFTPPSRTVAIMPSSGDGYKRGDAAEMVKLLLQSGANVDHVNAALDVNALEVALAPFLRGQIYASDTEALSAQRAIVTLLMDAMERTGQGTMRDDYQDAVRNLARNAETQKESDASSERLLPPKLLARIVALPRRDQILVCGKPDRYGFGTWFQSPPALGITYL